MADERTLTEVPSVSSVDELVGLLDEAAASGYAEMTEEAWNRLREELEPSTLPISKAS